MPPSQNNWISPAEEKQAVAADKVWISREEYDRLRQAELSRPDPTPYIAVPGADPAAGAEALESLRREQMIAGIVLGLIFVVGLTTPFKAFAAAAVPAFLILAAIGIVRYVRAKRRVREGKPVAKQGTAKLLLIIAGCILLVPILSYGALLLFVIILFSASGGAGS